MSEEKIREDENISNEDEDEKNRALKTIAKGGSIVLFGFIFARFLGYFFRVLVARFLGASAYGMYSIGFAVFSFVTVLAVLGTSSGVVRYIPYYQGKGEDRTRGILRTSLKISLPLGVLFSVLFFVFAPWMALNVFHTHQMTLVLRVFALTIPVGILLRVFSSTAVGLREVKYRIYSREFVERGSLFLLAVSLVLLGFGLFGVLIAFVLSTVAGTLAIAYYLVFKLDLLKRPRSSFSLKGMFSYSWPLVIAAIFMNVVSWTDILMIGYFLSESQAGIYNTALPTAEVLPFFLISLSMILLPVFSKLYGEGRFIDLRRIYQVTSKWAFALTLPFFLVLLLFPSQVIGVLFGAEYLPAATSLSILSLGFFSYISMGPVKDLLKSFGKTKKFALVTGASALVNVVLNIYLIPIYGIVGGAIATTSSVLLYSSLWLFFVYREARVHPFTLSYLKVALAGTTSILIVYFGLKMIFPRATLIIYSLAFTIFLLLYAGISLAIGVLDSEDIMILLAVEKRLGINLGFIKRIIKKLSV